MAAGLPPSLSALHAELTVSSTGAAGMVSAQKPGGGEHEGRMGREPRPRLMQVTLGWRAGVGAGGCMH